jgi:hypothetical protein
VLPGVVSENYSKGDRQKHIHLIPESKNVTSYSADTIDFNEQLVRRILYCSDRNAVVSKAIAQVRPEY